MMKPPGDPTGTPMYAYCAVNGGSGETDGEMLGETLGEAVGLAACRASNERPWMDFKVAPLETLLCQCERLPRPPDNIHGRQISLSGYFHVHWEAEKKKSEGGKRGENYSEIRTMENKAVWTIRIRKLLALRHGLSLADAEVKQADFPYGEIANLHQITLGSVSLAGESVEHRDRGIFCVNDMRVVLEHSKHRRIVVGVQVDSLNPGHFCNLMKQKKKKKNNQYASDERKAAAQNRSTSHLDEPANGELRMNDIPV
jgi:hypothetical protein